MWDKISVTYLKKSPPLKFPRVFVAHLLSLELPQTFCRARVAQNPGSDWVDTLFIFSWSRKTRFNLQEIQWVLAAGVFRQSPKFFLISSWPIPTTPGRFWQELEEIDWCCRSSQMKKKWPKRNRARRRSSVNRNKEIPLKRISSSKKMRIVIKTFKQETVPLFYPYKTNRLLR